MHPRAFLGSYNPWPPLSPKTSTLTTQHETSRLGWHVLRGFTQRLLLSLLFVILWEKAWKGISVGRQTFLGAARTTSFTWEMEMQTPRG